MIPTPPTVPHRILHVVFSLEPGGMENGLVNVANRLPANEFSLQVCCLERAGAFAKRLPVNADVVTLNKPPGFSPATLLALVRLLRRLKPDVIHTHNFGPLLYASLARSLAGRIPLLHGEHGMITAAENSPYYLWLRRAFYRCARRVHTVSHGLRQHYIAMGFPAAKIEAVVNGVDTVRFQPGVRPAARRHVGLPVEALVLGLVGRMDRGKRHLEMVNVFDQLAAAVPDLRLLLVGAGGDHEAQVLARISASAVTGRIHLAGYQEDPRCHYQAMDLLVVPSLREGFSNVVLEAMASGVPVLAHPTPGHAETITPAVDGFLADLATEANLLRQLQAAMAEPACLVELGKKAREKIATHYSLEGMAAHYARLYRELVRPPQGGANARVKA